MVKLSWQVVVVLCVAMCICGAIILASFWVEEAEQIRNYAMTLFAALAGFGGGKLQTAWEIKKLKGGNNA
jgi:hypothetical protein